MKIKRVESDIPKLLETLQVDSGGIAIMAKKAEIFTFHIKQIRCGAANILKQDALSIGAEFAMPNGVIECKAKIDEGVLIGSKRVLLQLAQKLKAQPYGLKELGKELKEFLNEKKTNLQLMGVVNANDDSFNQNSRFSGSDAIAHIQKLISQGADIIDLGGVSSRPGSVYCGVEEEMRRVSPILESIKKLKLYEKAVFSIDSFAPQVVQKALECGFKIVNDITGLQDEKLAHLAKEHGAKLCIMHMQNDPQTMQQNPHYEDVVLEVDAFFQNRMQIASDAGLKKEDIILDVGIGFGKSLEHNIELLVNLSHFKHFGCELLVGASRKSMIDKIFKSEVKDRLSGTLSLHLKAYQNGADIIRAHDVYEHKQAFSVYQKLQEF